jgi:Arc/MetJ-type ribon-helix-helix transcriptional regulator
MKLALTLETTKFIDEQVKAGRFSSPEELVEAAVADLRAISESELDAETIAAIHEGLDEADRGEGVDLATFRAEFFRRHSRPR